MTLRYGPVWNPARDALLERLVRNGDSRNECVAPLNLLPGAPVSKRAVSSRMDVLKLTLSDEHRMEVFRRSASLRVLRKGGVPRMTDERRDYLRWAYEGGDAVAEIFEVLNSLPGLPIKSPAAVYEHAKKAGLHRPVVVKALPKVRIRKAKVTKKILVPKLPPAQRLLPPVRMLAPPIAAVTAKRTACPAIADDMVQSRQEAAKAALRLRKVDEGEIARRTRLPLREVYRLAMDVRREMTA